ncbi:phosphoribosylanthranilate isomerase [Desulfuromonas sp. TF]|uniref:phosphoribosylanthranilate isomerase n=1 Tax=Desulfuromonas sp. TF TaxID=1232410 RepID=UPI0003F7EE08|nr:phosphoribosylanthranilate isomerase [Desulfuromonas sp. TF]
MVKVKICGITNIDDAVHAADCGADALGFVFFDKSPRCISPEQARGIIAELPPFVTAVGLFVNEEPQRVREIAEFCALDALQLHGDETPQDCLLPPHRVVKALRVKDASSLVPLADYAVSALLLDAWVSGIYGGTGHVFNWELAARAAETRRIILAGGLNPDNVAEAVRSVRPYGVDVSSGVEAFPGRKDPKKVEAFIRNAKAVTGDS